MRFLAAKCFLSCIVAASVAAQKPDELTVVRGRAIDRDGKPFAKCAVARRAESGGRRSTAAAVALLRASPSMPAASAADQTVMMPGDFDVSDEWLDQIR